MLQALNQEHCKETAGKVGPYVLLVLVVPGGILIALVLWIVRTWRAKVSHQP